MIDGLVSIIMPAYNAEKYISESIESVLAQTYKNWELIIVDDCSQDETINIIQRYINIDERIKCICLKVNQGVADARNIAIKNANGRYLAFLDSDDLWMKEKLSKQIDFMKNNGYAFTYHSYGTFYADKNKYKKHLVPMIIDYNTLLKGNNTGSCVAVCIDRYVVKNVFMPDCKHEDYVCWLNILKNNKLNGYGLKDVYGLYRIGKKSVSSNKIKCALWTWYVYRKSQNLSLFKAFYYMGFYIINGLRKYSRSCNE